MELISKISYFIHIISAILIGVSAFGFPIVESFFRSENSLILHKLSIKFSDFARNGGILSLITGIYNWILIGDVRWWLIAKIVLFLWFVVSGIFVGVKYIAKREELLLANQVSVEEVAKVSKAIAYYSYINLVVFLVIVFLAVFKPF